MPTLPTLYITGKLDYNKAFDFRSPELFREKFL